MCALCRASYGDDRRCCPVTEPHDSEVPQTGRADVSSLPLGWEWHPLNPKRQRRGRASPGVRGVRSVVLTTAPCTSSVGEHWGLRTADFRCHPWDNANRRRVAMNNRLQKRKPIFYIYVQGFKSTKKILWWFFFFLNVPYSHPTLWREYSERHIIKILYKGIYHIKYEHFILISPDLKGHKLAFFWVWPEITL